MLRDELDPVAVDDHMEVDPNPPESETEPAMMIAKRIAGFFAAVLALAVAFGLIDPLTPTQQQALTDNLIPIITSIVTVIGIIVPLVQGKLTRDRVVSPATAERLAVANTENGYRQGLEGEQKPQPILARF